MFCYRRLIDIYTRVFLPLLGKVSCVGSRADTSNNCFVVDAGASLYFDSESTCSDIIEESKADIKSAMNSGSFNELESRIINVTYLEESDLGISPASSSTSDDGPLFPLYAWALIGLGGVLLLMIAVLVLKRRQSATQDVEVIATPVDQEADVHCEPSIPDNIWLAQVPSSEKSSELLPQEDTSLLPELDSQEEDVPLAKTQDDNDLPPDTDQKDADAVLLKRDSKDDHNGDDDDDDDDDDAKKIESQDTMVASPPPPSVEDTSGDESSDEDSSGENPDETTEMTGQSKEI